MKQALYWLIGVMALWPCTQAAEKPFVRLGVDSQAILVLPPLSSGRAAAGKRVNTVLQPGPG